MGKITIHRALTELKTIDNRIDRHINGLSVVGHYSRDKKLFDFKPLKDFEQQAISDYQSINDLIDRQTKLKSAINIANATTKVTVGDKEMTILEAINFKNTVQWKRDLLNRLQSNRRSRTMEIERHNTQVNVKADNLAEIALGKDGVKTKSEDVETIRKPYIEGNELLLSDPINVDLTIDNLTTEISNFEMEVDASLSEINATTFIEVA